MKLSTSFEGQFEGWLCDPVSGVIFDCDGNSYDLNEIRAIFFNRQLIKSLTGTKSDPEVISLKQHLEKQISLASIPTITITWGDGRQQNLNYHESA